MCNETLNKENVNVDEFYRIITENKDCEIINRFIIRSYNPFKLSYSNMNESEFNKTTRNIRNEYETVSRNVYDKSKLKRINFNYEMTSIENQYKQKIETERKEEERRLEIQKQQQQLAEEKARIERQEAEEEWQRRRKHELQKEKRRRERQQPVYIHESSGCVIM